MEWISAPVRNLSAPLTSLISNPTDLFTYDTPPSNDVSELNREHVPETEVIKLILKLCRN